MCNLPLVLNIATNQCECPVQGSIQTSPNRQCECPIIGQIMKNNTCQCQFENQIIMNGTCLCPSGSALSENKCVSTVDCPENSYKVSAGQTCPTNQNLDQYPGCCCNSNYYSDNSIGVCFQRQAYCNCTQWMVTEIGQFYGIPVAWCYTDCFAPNSYPNGLNIACSPLKYKTYPNGTSILTKQLNTEQFCGCTDQPLEISIEYLNCFIPELQPFVKAGIIHDE